MGNASLRCPVIERGFNPAWNRNGADMPALADQVHDRPVALSHLDVIHLQASHLRSAQAATEQDRQHGVIALGTEAVANSVLENLGALLDGQPVPGAEPELLHAFHPADSGCQSGLNKPESAAS